MMYDAMIIGGGPAGLAAAIYFARQKLQFIVIADVIGGQAAWSSDVENYLGFHLIDGMHLVERFREHLNDYKDSFTLKETQRATELTAIDGGFRLKTEKGDTFDARMALIATGEKHRELGAPGEKAFYGRGVTYCATCDAPMYAGKDTIVVGGGNSAMEAALLLEKYAKSVTIVLVNDALKGDEMYKQRILASKMIRVIPNAKTTKIFGDTFVNGVEYELPDGKRQILDVQGVFIEIGLVPASDFVSIVKKDKWNEILVNERNETSVPGIWAAGDVTNITEKQIAVAVGEGSKAALQMIKWLQKQPDRK
ncbi:MAG: FAD-dependent oxidoreductase [Candidatus Uhrbacteria bacterium]|nr:FAD-dependent oxidoreductase [Candidatus Uhrbacteria bacterium]